MVQPIVSVGSRVLVANDPSWRDPVLGFVVRAGSNTVDIVCITESGIRYRSSCRYRHDPQTNARESSFWDGTNGVFDKCPHELSSDVEALRKECGQLRADLVQLAEAVKTALGKQK